MIPKNSPRALSTILTAIATIAKYSEISITDHLSREGIGVLRTHPNHPMQKHYEDLVVTGLIIKRGVSLPDTPIPPEFLCWTLNRRAKDRDWINQGHLNWIAPGSSKSS
jgi:hypothetical protein